MIIRPLARHDSPGRGGSTAARRHPLVTSPRVGPADEGCVATGGTQGDEADCKRNWRQGEGQKRKKTVRLATLCNACGHYFVNTERAAEPWFRRPRAARIVRPAG